MNTFTASIAGAEYNVAVGLARLGHTPQQAAETIADAAARRAGEKQDDITVAVFALGKAG